MAEQIQIEGLRELRTALRQAGREFPRALRIALNESVEVIAEAARAEVPTLTGAAADSIVARSTQTAARIKAGGRRAPHYPWLDFGGSVGRNKSVHRPFLPGGRYLYPALSEHREEMIAKLEEVLVEVAQAAGLQAESSG
jgi:hypothetical protein